MKNKELNYYEEIDIPPKENLSQGLKPFLEAELKKRNLVCLLSVIAISFMISEYASRGNGFLDHLLQRCEILNSPFVTSGLILLAFYSFDRLLKRSTVYRVYKAKRLSKNERYFFLYGFSVWVAAISSSLLFSILRVSRLVIYRSRFTRAIFHVAALLACWLPHALSEIQSSELPIRIVDINMYLVERVLWLPVALLLVLLFKSIAYTTIFEKLVYNKKMKSLDDIESKLRIICDTYRNSISSLSAESNYSLAVKGFGVVIVCHILRLKVLLLISLKERFVFIKKTFVWLSNLILFVSNAVIFILKNYSTGLILAVEAFTAIWGVLSLRELLIQLYYAIGSVSNGALIESLTTYLSPVHCLVVTTGCFLLSNSTLKNQRYKKRLLSAIRAIENGQYRQACERSKKINNSAHSESRKKIGLVA